MAEVFCQKHSTIEGLKEIVEELARGLSGEAYCGVMANFRHCCQPFSESSDGAFKHFVD